MLHPDDQNTFDKAKKLAYDLARYLKVELKVFEAKRRPGDFYTALGICYHNEKRISIKFRNKQFKADGGKWLDKIPEKDVFETVAHEVAHLIHPNHGAEFRLLEEELISKIGEYI